ncbi:HTH-type transcriptional activator CmpR [Koleobacter methoxysyntrophicus]|uniref:HTH-type transcriptional activator CmpR n=1 Tax=Koleobacter methoxysyntrophicus TaxID=2751313 RepID=A0A8A0RL43_9FIRM|nr:LysR family transcriptional regulator [Koleobacter methoxysyntrophicus]QSQ09115.1 HTH-type transcriptional activator CmpR [Koleobacter methoxysyntrophicus]
MNLDYLKAFYLTVLTNSISKAAKELHLTQPALSMQIQALEKELDSKLLVRSNKGVELTEAGQIVFDYAKTILALNNNIQRDLKKLSGNGSPVMIGSCSSVGEYALPCSIFLFREKYPDIKVNLEIRNTREVINRLINHSIDIGIIQGRVINQQIKLIKLAPDEIFAVVSPKLFKKDEITIEELKKLPLIIREKGSGIREIVEKSLEGSNLNEFNIIGELNSMEAIKSSIIAGKGISFMSRLSINKELHTGVLKPVNIKGLSFKSNFYIAHLKDKTLTTNEQKFISFIKSNKRGFC